MYALIFFLLLIFEIAYIRCARRAGIVDVPNVRSSHSGNVVRGGGILYFFGLLIWWLWGGCAHWPLMLAIASLAAISFADDLHEMPVWARLMVQIGAAVVIVWQSAGVPLPGLWWLTAVFVGVGMINAFNFMDGLNGLVGLYSIVLFAALAYINIYIAPGFIDQRLLIISCMTSLVFCFFNFRQQALCFAGDVGSIVVGAISFYAVLRLVLYTGSIGWAVLVIVFGVDVVLTIARRIAMGQNVLKAHRMHAYQIASNELGAGQLAVSSSVALIQLAIDIPAIFWGWEGLWYLFGAAALVGAAYIIIIRLSKTQG